MPGVMCGDGTVMNPMVAISDNVVVAGCFLLSAGHFDDINMIIKFTYTN